MRQPVIMTAIQKIIELLPPAGAVRPVTLAKLLVDPIGQLEHRHPGPANPWGEAGCSNKLPDGSKAFFGEAYRKFERRFYKHAEEEWRRKVGRLTYIRTVGMPLFCPIPALADDMKCVL